MHRSGLFRDAARLPLNFDRFEKINRLLWVEAV
jgi:hypothetical protein